VCKALVEHHLKFAFKENAMAENPSLARTRGSLRSGREYNVTLESGTSPQKFKLSGDRTTRGVEDAYFFSVQGLLS